MNPGRAFKYVYVLQNESGLTYTGCTNGLNKDDAYRRERYLKTGMRKRYIKNRLKSHFGKEL